MGRFSGLAVALSTVADRLKEQRTQREELSQKKNLLGFAGLTEGKLVQAQPNETGAMNIEGTWYKKAPSEEMELINSLEDKPSLLGQETTQKVTQTSNSGLTNDKLIRGIISKKLGVPYEEMKTPEERQADIDQAAKKTEAIEFVKPYTDVEAGVISKSELLVPKIDELIAMIEKKGNIFGTPGPGEWTGASRIAAFGEKGAVVNPLKRGLTIGKGREAGILLKDIKILAFGEGGKTLSENERMTALSNIDPSYKTEEQWVAGLKDAKAMLLRKADLMKKKNPFKNNVTEQKEDFFQMTDEELMKIAAGE